MAKTTHFAQGTHTAIVTTSTGSYVWIIRASFGINLSQKLAKLREYFTDKAPM